MMSTPPYLAAARFPSRRSVVHASGGMVATSQPLAAQAGLQVLLQGGNAADAAVASAAVLAVVEPMSTGLGGDAFALVYSARDGAVTSLNGSGRAAAAATPARFAELGLDTIPLDGPLPVTVPGVVDAWHTLIQRHGRMPLADVLRAAIGYAEHGFPVSEVIGRAWAAGEARLRANPASARTFLVDGVAPRVGTRFRQPALAQTLRAVAEGGPAAFYAGPIAAALVAALEQAGGWLTLQDFAAHHSTWDTPLSTLYRGYRVYECPPNGQGLTALLALNILDGFDLASLGAASPAALHLQIEALRLAFADAAAIIADPQLVPVPAAALLEPAYTAARRARIDPRRAAASAPAGRLPGGHDTVYLSVVDAEGNAVSFINSTYHGWGSAFTAGDTGIVLQNRGAGFVLDPSHPNVIAPRKRPYHTIIPCLVTHAGRLWASFGVMGGFMQPQGHVQMLVNMLDFGMNPQESLDAPRFELIRPYQEPRAVATEYGATTERALQALGHQIAERESQFGFGGGQIIVVDEDGIRHGGSDPRKDGAVVAY
jgi:gamma-glutamyltranspeptidase/glutathione hydrolase